MWIQILLVAGLIVFAVVDLRGGGGGARHQALRRIGLVVFIGLGVFSILFPDWLGWVAGLVGVGRGADLVFYSLVVAFLFYVATNHRRFIAIDRRMTVLARQLALTEARLDAAEASATTPTPRPLSESVSRSLHSRAANGSNRV